MAITAGGVGSGLDVETIVSQLMVLERRPLDALEQREREFRAELSAYGRLKSAVSAFEGAMQKLGSLDKFKIFSSSSSDEDVAAVSTTSSAAPGTFELDVSRLAQNHKLVSGEFDAAALFGGFSGDGVTAADSLDITVGGDTLSLDLSTAMTLSEMRDAINTAEDNPGVTATILNTAEGRQRLVLTSNESGQDAQIQLAYGGTLAESSFGDGVSAIGDTGFETGNRDGAGTYMTDLTLLDAAFKVDGFDITSASNSVSSVMDGVSLELKAVGATSVNVSRDNEAITESVQGFVNAYNSLQGTISSLAKGDLSGDSTLRSLQAAMRGVMNTPPGGITSMFDSLSQVGVATERDGTLSLKSDDLKAAMDTDFAGVAQLFANDDQGYAFRFQALAESLQDSGGLIDSREDGINARIRSLDSRQLNKEYQLELKEKQLRSQYASLDALVGSLQTTSQFLYQQLGG